MQDDARVSALLRCHARKRLPRYAYWQKTPSALAEPIRSSRSLVYRILLEKRGGVVGWGWGGDALYGVGCKAIRGRWSGHRSTGELSSANPTRACSPTTFPPGAMTNSMKYKKRHGRGSLLSSSSYSVTMTRLSRLLHVLSHDCDVMTELTDSLPDRPLSTSEISALEAQHDDYGFAPVGFFPDLDVVAAFVVIINGDHGTASATTAMTTAERFA